MNKDEVVKNKLVNFLHTVLLFSVLLTLMVFSGYLLAGSAGVLWAVIAGFFFLFFSPSLSPQLILKMYRASIISIHDAPRLYHIIEELAHRAELPELPRLYYVPSNIMNAFSVGRKGNAAIGVTDGLLRRLDMRELTGVLAHEISHIRNNDMRVMGFADIISRITGLFSNVGQVLLFLNIPLIIIGAVSISWPAIFLLIMAPALSGLMQLAISRTREFDADLDAARLTGDPAGLASALQRMDYYESGIFERIFFPGRSDPNPSLLRTHPKTQDRVKRLLQLRQERRLEFVPEPEENFLFPPVMLQISRNPRWRRLSGLWY